MTTTYTQYNDAVAYNAAIRYDGVGTAATVVTDTGNRHSAIWRPQHGRSHTHRRPTPSLPTFSGVHHRSTPAPRQPEVTVSQTINKIILAPDRVEAEAKILEFVANRKSRQEQQPALPETAPTQSYVAPPKLPAETAGEQASARQAQARADYARRERDDRELLELVSLLEGF